MSNFVIAPILIPFITAIIMILTYKHIKVQKIVGSVSVVAQLGVVFYLLYYVVTNGILVFEASNWQAPFGIVIVADVFSCLMLIVSAIVSAACFFFSFNTIDEKRYAHFYHVFYFFMIVGINGAFSTGDIFNMFVFFEIMLMASYALACIGSEKGQLRESFKYVILNVVSSALFLVGLALLYGMVGTLNMADIASKVATVENQGLITVVAMIFLVVFGFKGAVFPLCFWLPQSYYQPPSAISALFTGLLTKVGVYGLIRIFTLIFVGNLGYTHTILLVISAMTMVLGVLGAICQMDFKGILVYHCISQVGYMIMGLGVFTVVSIAGSIFHIMHHAVVKSSLFLMAGTTKSMTGTTDLHKLGGLLTKYPVLGWSFFVAAASLAGAPPLSGFFSKFLLLQGGVEAGQYWIVAIAIIVGFLTLFSMIKIFLYAFWGENKNLPVAPHAPKNYLKLMPPILGMIVLTVAMGIGSSYVIDFCMMASEQLMDPSIYIAAVLGA